MKHYVYILSIVFLIMAFGGCRSNHSLQSSSKEVIETTIKEQSTNKEDSSTTTRKEVDKTTEISIEQTSQTDVTSSEDKQADEYKNKKTEIDIYDKDGNIRATIRTTEKSGRVERSTSDGRTLHASSGSSSSAGTTKETEESETTTSVESETDIDINVIDVSSEDVVDIKNSDSRLVQGWEWLMIILPITVICGIIYLIRYGRKKSNSDRSN